MSRYPAFLLGWALAASLAAPAFAIVGPGECRDELVRAQSALRRAQRSEARAGIALFRVTAELRSVGLLPAAPLGDATEANPVASIPQDSGIEALAAAAWDLKRRTAELSGRAIALMAPHEIRTKPTLELGPRIPDEEERLLKPGAETDQPCLAWIFYAQRAAFRAEQSAQLAEVAADQAIALAKLERDRVGQ